MQMFRVLHNYLQHLAKKTDRFSDLVFDKKWVQLIHLLESPKFKNYLKNRCGPFHFHHFNYLSMIHLACMMRAPLYVISTLVNIFPSSVILPDKLLRLPLHIACKYGADVEVISFLIDKNPGSLKQQDAYGKTPLHLACKCQSMEYKELEKCLKILMKKCPSSLDISNAKGLNVYEYACEKNLEIHLIQLIQWEMDKQLTSISLSVIEEESYCSEESLLT